MSDRVVVLAGGLSPERDVSVRSGRRIAEELRGQGFEVQVLDLDAKLLPNLLGDRPACVIPLVHGAPGEDGSLQELLETLRLPFVGSASAACRRSYDKAVAAALLSDTGLSIPDSVSLPHAMFRELGAIQVLDAVLARLGLPVVVKPTRGGSALGVSVVRDESDLPSAMVSAMAYGDTVQLEQFIEGTEVAVSIVEESGDPIALPPVEIVPDGGIYDYIARYTAGTTEFFAPARLAPDALERATTAAVAAHRFLGLRDWSRSDLIVDGDGTPWLLEVNVAPGMTETSLYPQGVQAAGRDLGVTAASFVSAAVARVGG